MVRRVARQPRQIRAGIGRDPARQGSGAALASGKHAGRLVLVLSRHYDDAIETLRKRASKWIRLRLGTRGFGACLRTERDVRGSNSRTAQSVELANHLSIRMVWLAQAYALSGNKDEARRMRVMLEGPARRNEIDAPAMAVVDIALGESDRAVVRLKNASENHHIEPMSEVAIYDPLRAPRFAKFFPRV